MTRKNPYPWWLRSNNLVGKDVTQKISRRKEFIDDLWGDRLLLSGRMFHKKEVEEETLNKIPIYNILIVSPMMMASKNNLQTYL